MNRAIAHQIKPVWIAFSRLVKTKEAHRHQSGAHFGKIVIQLRLSDWRKLTMIKYVYCLRKRADLTDEEFHTYWKENATFIRGLAKLCGRKKYIQSHKLDTPLNDEFVRSRGFDSPPYDGVTELWWNSMEDFLPVSTHPKA